MAYLQPERYFSRLSNVSIKHDLLELGYKNVLLDIEGSIPEYVGGKVPRDISLWFEKAQAENIKFCLVSNAWSASESKLASKFDIPAVTKACKPFPAAFLIALKKLGAARTNSVVIGSNVIADVLGAHNVGLPAYLLTGVCGVKNPQLAKLQELEQAYIGKKNPEGGYAILKKGE